MHIPAAVAQLIGRGPIAHVVTLNGDGSPHVSMAWVGIEDDELVIGTIPDQVKLRNIRRDPRVAVSMVTGQRNAYGLDEYVVLHGRARLTEGGGAELLGRLAKVYIGPDALFPRCRTRHRDGSSTSRSTVSWVSEVRPGEGPGAGLGELRATSVRAMSSGVTHPCVIHRGG